jgi:hypothetical protein
MPVNIPNIPKTTPVFVKEIARLSHFSDGAIKYWMEQINETKKISTMANHMGT